MHDLVRHCTQNMSVDALSGWRDDTLGPEVAERVATHLPTCRACQAYLHEYEQDALRLRRFTPPSLQAEAWQLIERRMRQPPAPPPRLRVIFTRWSVPFVVLTLIVLFALLLNNGGRRPSPVTQVPTTTVAHGTPNGAPTGTPNARQGWTDIPALSFGKSVAFAASDPQTGYVCGNNPAAGATASLQIAATHDGGRTWGQPLTSGIANQAACRLAVNPSDPQEVAMNVSACWEGCSGSGQYGPDLYRSFDGGRTWQPSTFPTSGGNVGISAPVWAKGAMFVYTTTTGANSVVPFQRGAHSVAVSLNNGPLGWVNDATMFAGMSDLSVEITNAFTYNGAYFVQVNGATFKTTDYGATWSRLASVDTIVITAVAADGSTLLGQHTADHQYIRSVDGGVSWTPFAVPPNTTRIVTTPNGTYYVWQDDASATTPKTIYRQTPGGTTWTPVAVIDPLQRPTLTWAVVSWDAHGQPQHLWATEATEATSAVSVASSHIPASASGYLPGIAQHAP